MILGAGGDGEMAGGHGRIGSSLRGDFVDLVDANSRPVLGGNPDGRELPG
jgi:hypothetical protein